MDKSRAVELYREGAKNGSVQAKCNLGYCFLKGIGTEKDGAQAVPLFEEAAKSGSARGIYLLGYCFETGTGVPGKNLQRARELYQSVTGDSRVGKMAQEALKRLDRQKEGADRGGL